MNSVKKRNTGIKDIFSKIKSLICPKGVTWPSNKNTYKKMVTVMYVVFFVKLFISMTDFAIAALLGVLY